MTGASLDPDLVVAAGLLGLWHTLLGPDHIVPFVVLGRLRSWSAPRTAFVTAVCGAAHVTASLCLASVGLAAGAALGWLERAEQWRGELAAWLLAGVGAAYALWGVRVALRRRGGWVPHRHGSIVHIHPRGDRPHEHDAASKGGFWTLFLLLVLGPCEPMIPLFAVPASRGAWPTAWAMAAVFSVVTVVTMVSLVLLFRAGIARLRLAGAARWSHAMAGLTLFAAGLTALWL